MSADACDACLRRTWLIGALAAAIEIEWQRRVRLPELLALGDQDLIAALGGRNADDLRAQWQGFDAGGAHARCERAALTALCRHDARYPERLNELPDPPAVLHVGGGVERLLTLLAEPTVAIVGARRASDYGLDLARTIGRGVASAGVTVVSGMALGVDSAAHEGAFEAAGESPAPASAIAVLGSGADVAYPARKRGLHQRLLRDGVVVSEMPPGFKPRRWCFPARNRLIAALGQVVVVVEAGARSGSLITANLAADLGRDVAAVPGRVTAPQAKGTNGLLYDGAQLVRDAGDVLELALGPGVGPRDRTAAARDRLAPDLRAVFDAVAGGRDTLAALARTPAEAERAMIGLAELELEGFLRRELGGRYAVAS